MKNNNQKNKDINIKTIWKAFRSEKGRKLSFVIFYIFFFIFLFIFFRTNTSNNTTPNNKELETSLPFVTSTLEKNDYTFKYIVNSNSNELLYLVNKKSNSIIVNDDTGTFEYTYKNGVLTTNDLKKVIHSELLSIYELKRIIKSSKLVSETKLNETNEYLYTYKIMNSDLSNILLDTITNGDKENEIIVKTNSNKEIKEINLDLINYEKEINNDLSSFNITIIMGE
ncbi:MAG: hypothetical protein IKN63_05875 [Bacilli bacterium]|nr:hypothetical protein [Bacilli bacterium]